MNFQSIIQGIRDKVGGFFQPKLISPLPDNYQFPQPVQAAPAPQGNVLGATAKSPELPPVTEAQIREGWSKYGDGNAPAATASATFAEVANQYPVLRKYPGLLPAMAMKESSGGKANTKNWFNWGLYNDDYNETDPNEVIRSVARAIGGGKSNSAHYYEKFRETGDIRDMLDRYAPPTENDTGLYHKQLMDWMKMFEGSQR